VTGDRKLRFEDDTMMSTSMLMTPASEIGEGMVVTTLNSRYLLARRAEVTIRHMVYASDVGCVPIGPDGEPVTEIKVVKISGNSSTRSKQLH
jgi:hypothetical protein